MWQPHRAVSDTSALVFRIDEPSGDETEQSYVIAPDHGVDALSVVARYVGDNQARGARLSPLYDGEAGTVAEGNGWKVVLPGRNPLRRWPAGVHYLQLANARDADRLTAVLRADPRVRYVHPPLLYRSSPIVRARLVPPLVSPTWGLKRCGFDQVWSTLDRPHQNAKPIAMIDEGIAGLKHVELTDRVDHVPPGRFPPALTAHGPSVAAVMTARRDMDADDGEVGMDGACSAAIRYYDAWVASDTGARMDYCAFANSLKDAAAGAYPVLNMSFTSPCIDQTTREAIAACIDADVAVVAAMGEASDYLPPPLFPASLDKVIAVAATMGDDSWRPGGQTGGYVWLGAPGDEIWSILGDRGYASLNGNSFSCAYVSAAIWMARTASVSLSVDDVRDLLARTAQPNPGGPDDKTGHGRLDVVAMAKQL